MTLITTHIGRCTIIRDPGEPMPAWLGGGCLLTDYMTQSEAMACIKLDKILRSVFGMDETCDRDPSILDVPIERGFYGEDITLPPTEGQI